jgi:enamine deaminase RidA (YjgF/YER057c/UK114 family)
VSIDERGTLIGVGDLAAQTAQAMRNVGLALAAAGARYADVVKITTYVVNYKPEHRAVIGSRRTK